MRNHASKVRGIASLGFLHVGRPNRSSVLEPVEKQQYESEGQESPRRQQHDDPGLEVGAEQGNAEQGAVAEYLPRATQDEEGDQESPGHADGVQHRHPHGVLGGECLLTPQDHAVGDDEGNEGAEFLVQGGEQGQEGEIGHGDEGGDDDDEAGDADLFRDQAPRQGNQETGTHQDEKGGEPHGDGVDGGVGDRQHGTKAQHLHEEGIVPPQALGQFPKLCFRFSWHWSFFIGIGTWMECADLRLNGDDPLIADGVRLSIGVPSPPQVSEKFRKNRRPRRESPVWILA